MPLGKEVDLGPGHIVLDGNPVGTQPLTASPPHFWAHVYYGQTVAHLSKCWALVYFSFVFPSLLVIARSERQWTAEGSVFDTVSLLFFACAWNISETAEGICAKFTGKTCLVPRLDDFEDQGQKSKVKVTMGKKLHFLAFLPAYVRFMFGKTSLSSSLLFRCFFYRCCE